MKSFIFIVMPLGAFLLACLFGLKSLASLQVLAGMNVHPAEFDGLKQEYTVKGYPTFCYFE